MRASPGPFPPPAGRRGPAARHAAGRGSLLTDAGSTLTDAGSTPTDVGSTPTDAGSTLTGRRPGDVPDGIDLTRFRPLAWWLRRRSWQFQLILPNQILFWVVVIVGFAGPAAFDDNFATTITWYVWFSLVFGLILLTGRGWCAVCPFGGLAEWLQRGRGWHPRGTAGRGPGAGRPAPSWLARYGYAPTAVMFGVLTWIEEYYQVADGRSPSRTSWTIIGIIGFALIAFLLLERRAFCRFLCPLGGLIGVLGAGAPLAGFRSRDRSVCRECTTKDCLRGSGRAYGCPWFSWPGSGETGVSCGLCGECFRSCSRDNVGLYATLPLTALTRQDDRRADVAWTVAILGGIMVHQHLHETSWWDTLDTWANGLIGVPHGPNPVLYVVLTAAYTAALVVPAWAAWRLLYQRPGGGLPWRGSSFIYRTSPFRSYFLPLFYAAVPLLGGDFLAVQLLGFLQDAPKVVPAAVRLLGLSPEDSGLAWLSSAQLMSVPAVVRLQSVVLALGATASAAVIWRSGAELARVSRAPRVTQLAGAALMLLGGGMLIWFYQLTQGAAG